jgi:hypothetical protein
MQHWTNSSVRKSLDEQGSVPHWQPSLGTLLFVYSWTTAPTFLFCRDREMGNSFQLLGLILALFIVKGSHCESEAMVTIRNGQILGSFMTSASGRQFLAFQGIFYAEAPTGDRRFKVFKYITKHFFRISTGSCLDCRNPFQFQ